MGVLNPKNLTLNVKITLAVMHPCPDNDRKKLAICFSKTCLDLSVFWGNSIRTF